MGDYGFKISQDGYDVKTADVKNLIMTSKANQWKIHMKGSVTFTSDYQTINVAHNLGYTPAFLALYHSKYWDVDRYGFAFSGQAVCNSTNLKLIGNDTNDVISYVILKDFGA